MKKIFLIGGGEINRKETVKIDRDIIREGGGIRSRILFLPTAANDDVGYIKNFVEYFLSLGCNNILWAKLTKESTGEIKEKMAWATIIYLGGGDTARLIKLFKKRNLIGYLKNRLREGVVLVGMSAGAIALGEKSLISKNSKKLIFVRGFGFLPKIICLPHYKKKDKNILKQVGEKFLDQTILGIQERSAIYVSGKKIKYFGNYSIILPFSDGR